MGSLVIFKHGFCYVFAVRIRILAIVQIALHVGDCHVEPELMQLVCERLPFHVFSPSSKSIEQVASSSTKSISLGILPRANWRWRDDEPPGRKHFSKPIEVRPEIGECLSLCAGGDRAIRLDEPNSTVCK